MVRLLVAVRASLARVNATFVSEQVMLMVI